MSKKSAKKNMKATQKKGDMKGGKMMSKSGKASEALKGKMSPQERFKAMIESKKKGKGTKKMSVKAGMKSKKTKSKKMSASYKPKAMKKK